MGNLNCCRSDNNTKDKEMAFHLNRDKDDEGNVAIYEDPATQSRVLVVNKGPKHQNEMYVIKEESQFATQSSAQQYNSNGHY